MSMRMEMRIEMEMTPIQTINARVISIDETRNYNIKPEHEEYIDKILGVYLYDKNMPTVVCEITPSYYLIHLYDEVVIKDGSYAVLPDENEIYDREEIYETYENTGISEDIYVHVSTVDRLEKSLSNERFRYYIEGEEELPEDVTYEEYMEELREDCCANHRL